TIWAPLLESKYGALADQTPATIMWATIRRYYSTRGKGGGRETLGFLTGGLRTFYDALTKAIESNGGVVRCREPVVAVDDSEPGKVVVRTPLARYEFDRVISALPTVLLRKAAPGLRGMYEGDGRGPRFLGVVCVALVLRRPLSPYYITNLIQRGFPFCGVIEVSNLTGLEELNGRRLVMLPRYDVPESPWFEREAGEIVEEFLARLRPIWPDIGDNLVRWFVHRDRRVQALWIDAPPPRPEPRRTPDGRVWSVNAELAGRDTLNNNAIVRAANDAAKAFLKS
ncbi:MAG: FAD-dependent oxidoreductase, partial [Candidatus Sumerlaeota bacterium]|nr:FAD-dependent oxidoreductase [Candidatus Sumerlaeota bacterium]